ncbi:MAG: hypothetical protein FJ144_26465 [Deltaproteobacteria bacterium]|nr:hypothetical protein [Deltaproteobacteria bacterium]
MQSVKVAARHLVLAVSLLLATGCYWSRYSEVMAMHLELLDQYSRKLQSLSASGRTVALEDWAEFVYPLERARDFARIAAQRYPDLDSLARFREVLERYAAVVDDPGVLSAPDGGKRLAAEVAALEKSIEATRRALEREESS